jgi:hypothetical protein
MATEAQIAANRINAQASTGPATAAGQARASRNALTSGLYSRGDFVLPDERDLYIEFCAAFQSDLAPDGAVEQTLSAEVIHAAWRLRRCSAIASGMAGSLETSPEMSSQITVDPMVDPAAVQTQQSLDRARNDAHRAFQRSISELRRLQTERRFRAESLPADFDATTLGLASFKDMAPALMNATQRQLLLEKRAAQSRPSGPAFTIRTQTAPEQSPQTPRNSPCPCGSGAKFKRCCGKGAPALLNRAA